MSLIKPLIICLCGSTKFKKEFEEANLRESLKGHIVLTVSCFNHADQVGLTEEQKKNVDQLHFRKIELADEILVINPSGYIGESTRNEIEYASKLNKKIRFLLKELG